MPSSVESLPDGAIAALSTMACSVAPGRGGLGRHFEEFIELARGHDPDAVYLCPGPGLDDARAGRGRRVDPAFGGVRPLLYSPLRWDYAATTYAASATFDVALTRALPGRRDGFSGFAGQSLRTFRRARREGYGSLGLITPNSHVDNIARSHEIACRRYPVDGGWLHPGLRRRTLVEYRDADVIFVNTGYQLRSFLDAGVAEAKLVQIPLHPDPRFTRRLAPPAADHFCVAYVGRFDVPKGIPLLLDAFFAAAGPNWRLVLQGEFCTRAIRRYMQRRIAGDERVTVKTAGDPRVVLESAHVFVHPSFDDGFGYGPVEAMAVGVPVIVTDRTGMMERVTEGADGFVVPSGDLDAMVDRMRDVALYGMPVG